MFGIWDPCSEALDDRYLIIIDMVEVRLLGQVRDLRSLIEVYVLRGRGRHCPHSTLGCWSCGCGSPRCC